MFSRKGRSLDAIPPTEDALALHIMRAVYQASHCWSQSLIKDAVLPNLSDWG